VISNPVFAHGFTPLSYLPCVPPRHCQNRHLVIFELRATNPFHWSFQPRCRYAWYGLLALTIGLFLTLLLSTRFRIEVQPDSSFFLLVFVIILEDPFFFIRLINQYLLCMMRCVVCLSTFRGTPLTFTPHKSHCRFLHQTVLMAVRS